MKKKSTEMSAEEFREAGFILGVKVLKEIMNLVTGPKLTRAEMKRRVERMVGREHVERRKAVRGNRRVRQLVRAGRYDEARALMRKGGA